MGYNMSIDIMYLKYPVTPFLLFPWIFLCLLVEMRKKEEYMNKDENEICYG